MEPFQSTNASLRWVYYVSLAVVGLLLLLSILWYKQRVLFIDPAWISFEIIQKGEMSIPEHRYGAFVSQMWLLGGAAIHLPTGLLLTLYSASFYSFYFTVALVLGRVLRQYALAILLALYHTLIVSDVFFWPNNEVHQGVGWMMLFLGLFFRYLKEGKAPLWAHVLMLIALFLAVFSHFIVIVPFSFLWVYWLLNDRQYWDTKQKRLLLVAYVLAVAATFLIKLNMGRTGWYDREKLLPVLHVQPRDVFASFANGGAKSMLALIITNYWIIIPIFLAGVFIQIRLRKWLLLAWTIAYTAGFFSLVCLTYFNAYGRELQFYMESEWMAWGIILATPLIVHGLPRMKARLALATLSLIFLVRLVYIYNAFLFFDARYRILDGLSTVLRNEGTHKAILLAERSETDRLILNTWGTPYETLLLSSIKGQKPCVTFYIQEPGYKIEQPSERVFIGPYSRDTVEHLNQYYFDVDGTQAYKVMQLKDLLQRVKK